MTLANPPYTPTPADIAREKAKIRDGWNPVERRRRGETVEHWTLPVVRWDDVEAAWVEVEESEP